MIALATLLLWVSLLAFQLDRVDPVRLFLSPYVQAILLSSTCLLAMPSSIALPAYRQSLALIPERMSLTVAVLTLAWFAKRRLPRWTLPTGCVLAVSFFGVLYSSTAWTARLEQELTATVRLLPQGARVVSGLRISNWRLDPSLHLLDRACLGWCYSYGDYEPSTGAFRLRAVAENPIVLAGQDEKVDLELGRYVVKRRDLPLYQVVLLDRQRLRLATKQLKEGERVTLTRLDGNPMVVQ